MCVCSSRASWKRGAKDERAAGFEQCSHKGASMPAVDQVAVDPWLIVMTVPNSNAELGKNVASTGALSLADFVQLSRKRG
jgi:hypothetical protein